MTGGLGPGGARTTLSEELRPRLAARSPVRVDRRMSSAPNGFGVV
jgi:hypothetical protein